MKQTITFGQFQDAFYNMDRQNQFTYKGKKYEGKKRPF